MIRNQNENKKFTKELAQDLARWMGVRYATPCNSDLAANLIAISVLTSNKLGSKAIKPGDEVITSSVDFPNIVNPIIQVGAIPVLVDVTLSTLNPTPRMVSEAITDKTKAIFLAHTLGNPFDTVSIKEIAESNELYFIEDCSQAIDAFYDEQRVGTFGNLSTGKSTVFTDSSMLGEIADSLVNFGLESPTEYSHIGYDFSPSEFRAWTDIQELKKDKIRKDLSYLKELLEDLSDYFIFPEHIEHSKPCWAGFPITLKPDLNFTRDGVVQHLDLAGNATDFLFAGGLARHRAYSNHVWRCCGELPKSETIRERTLVLMCHNEQTMRNVSDSIHLFISGQK